jgi:hypothetical protein
MTLKTDNRTVSSVMIGLFLVALAVGLLAWHIGNLDGICIIWITLLVFGICFLALAPIYKNNSNNNFGPSNDLARAVSGLLMILIGTIGLLWSLANLDTITFVATLLIGIAAIGIFAALYSHSKEGSQ